MNAIYARQSVDKKDSISIDTQIELALKSDPDTPYQVYIDKGFSGKNTKRPQFQELMKDVRDRKVKKIIVYKIDRFSRSLLDFSVAWHELQQYGVDFVSVNEQFDTSTPMGKAMLFITEIFAELERETISMRLTDNYYSRIKSGRWPGGPAPFGFQNSTLIIEGKEVPTIIKNDNALYIQELFKDYNAGYSLRYLAGKWNKSGIGNGKWTSGTISNILKNPAYVKADADVYLYYKSLGVKINNQIDDFDGINAGTLLGKNDPSGRRRNYTDMVFTIANWKGFIDTQIWLACQTRLQSNKQIKNTGKGKYTWLSGKIKCGECKHSVQVFPHYSRKKEQYNHVLCCTGHCNKFCDHIVKIRIPELESIITEEIKKELEKSHNEVLEEETFAFSAEDKISLAKIEESIDNLIRCIEEGEATSLTITHINRKLEELEEKRKEIIENMQDGIITKKRKIQYKPIIFEELSFDERKVVVEDYIDKIYLYQSGDIEICWKI